MLLRPLSNNVMACPSFSYSVAKSGMRCASVGAANISKIIVVTRKDLSMHRICWIAIGIASLDSPCAVAAQDTYSDPAGSGAIVGALTWLQGTLLGTVATIAAVIAVATVGFLMLTGRMNWRYGATVILGCFILFGAASIVGGIRTAATADPGY